MSRRFDVDAVRAHFPGLRQKQIFFDNAGGSQVLKEVADAVSEFLLYSNAQVGASYQAAQTATQRVGDGTRAVAQYLNADETEVVLGPSSTQLLRNLALTLRDYLTPDSEIVVSKLDHEANISPWVALAAWTQCKLVWWAPSSTTNPVLDADNLRRLMTPKTRLVVCTYASNILGTVYPIKDIAATVHKVPGALFCVDGVVYMPHHTVDVRDLGVDFYVFSWYKVYGPHIASLYAARPAQAHMRSLGHFFKPTDTLDNLLNLASANYELTAGIPAVCKYLATLPWAEIEHHEEAMQGIVIDYLLSQPHVYQIYGLPVKDCRRRMPIVSFTVAGRRSRDVVEAIEARSNYGCRWGSFFSNRLVKDVLGLDPADGLVRVSLAHYNTEDEVRGFVEVLDAVVTHTTSD